MEVGEWQSRLRLRAAKVALKWRIMNKIIIIPPKGVTSKLSVAEEDSGVKYTYDVGGTGFDSQRLFYLVFLL